METYDVVFPGSEMPEWFSHQCMRDEVNIMEPFSHLCNDWIGIVVCIVFCPLPHHQIHGNPVSCILSANGKEMSLTHIIDNEVVASAGVYGPNLNKKHRLMWEELTGMISWWDVPWCLGGDFNIIRFPSECLGAASFSRAMNGFSDFVSLHGLMDIHMEGGLFTWSNSSSASRLYRFLFSPLFGDHFSQFSQKRLSRVLSNHFPILLEGWELSKRKNSVPL